MFIDFFIVYRLLQTYSVQKEEKMENLGIDPGASSMQSGRSTIWANPPACRKPTWIILELSYIFLTLDYKREPG